MSLIFHSVPFPITKIVELFVALLENFKISSESKTPVIFILTATYTTRPTFIDILLIMDTLLGTVTPKRELLFNYSMFIFLQETQILFDLYAAVICVALKQNKHASELPLLGKNIPKDHGGIFPPVLPTSISLPPIDINLALFPSGNCVIFSIFLDNRLLFNRHNSRCICK